MTFYRPTIGIAFAVTLLAACASPHERTRAPAPLAVPAKPQYVQADPIVDNSAQPTDLVQSATPRVDMPSSASVSLGSGEMLPPMPDTPER